MAFIQENNVYSKRMRPVIIVNVSHGATDYMALRARDFTPTRTRREANSGGAAAFLDFLGHELIPSHLAHHAHGSRPPGSFLRRFVCDLCAGAAACTVPADCRGEPIIGVGWPTAL